MARKPQPPKLKAVQTLARLTKAVVVGVSGGKDSVATLELCHEHGLKLTGYFLYQVPGLSFQARYLDYLRRRYDLELVEWPHPDLTLFLQTGRYCQPVNMPTLQFREVWDAARQRFGVHWLVTGEKKIDSLERRGMMTAWGAVQVGRRRAFPLAEWNGRDVFAYLKHRNVALAPDYALFGTSLANPLNVDFLGPIRTHYPEDYARITRFYPFAEAALEREQMAEAFLAAEDARAAGSPTLTPDSSTLDTSHGQAEGHTAAAAESPDA